MSNESVIPTPATPDICTVAVLIEGKEIPAEYNLISVYVSKELNKIPFATLYFQDGDASKADFEISNTKDLIPGKKIEIKLGYRSMNDSVFKGIILKQSIKVRKNTSQLIVECRDEAVKMTLGLNSRYYIDKKDSEIMEQIIGLYGLQKEVTATKPTLKEIVQYDACDWDFLVSRAEANGMVVQVESGKISVAPPATAEESLVNVQYGATLLELDADIDARWQSTGIKAECWSATDQALLSADAKEPPKLNSGNLTIDTLSAVIGGDPHKVRHGGKLSQPELQAIADGRLLKERLAKIRGHAKFQGFAGVTPGKIIQLSGVGERFSGKMYVSGVRHSLTNGNWETDVQFGLTKELFAETYQLRPLPASGLLPAIGGLHIGIVTALEKDPDGEDRIKVRIPLISATEEGVWARISTLDAGKERGTFFRPEIKDEVVVGFLNENPCHPIVLGMCHSSSKPAPVPAKDVNHLKGYVSREKLKFTFDDEKKVITLETPGGNKIVLSDEAKGINIEDQNGNKITLNDSGIVIESAKAMSLKASNDLKAEAVNMELKASSALKASGASSAEITSASITVKGSATTEVSSASTTIKGSATTVIQGGMVQIN